MTVNESKKVQDAQEVLESQRRIIDKSSTLTVGGGGTYNQSQRPMTSGSNGGRN